jgi:hypothetical protein
MLIHRTMQSTKRQGQKCTGQSSCKECSASCAYHVFKKLELKSKRPRPSNNLARVLNKLWPKCTRPKPNQPPCIKESCLVYKRLKSHQPIHVSKKMEPQSISLFKKPLFKSKRHSESLCFKCSSQRSRTKP